MEPIFLEPVFQERIWGGTKLQEEFKFDLSEKNIGEAWVISSHPKGVSKITSPGTFFGMGLDELYRNHPEIFGTRNPKSFPLLVKLLDAEKELSVQVHPDDDYAKIHEGGFGKTECWYVISAEPDATIIYGHNADSKEEFEKMINEGKWDELLREVPVKAGDFFYVPHGTIHSIGGGIVLLETQQNSDTTYRLYDYDRTDERGLKRELHLSKSIETAQVPHIDPELSFRTSKSENGFITHFLTNEFFSVYKWKSDGDLKVKLKGFYTLATVIEGEGAINTGGTVTDIRKGDSFIIPNGVVGVTLSGKLTVISSNPEES